ncbi:MAG TPA: hypothetical protein PLB55_25320, partial [Prosthecobacter sp.]|nr:hypothetical protein [Prosthecobacter sp.]
HRFRTVSAFAHDPVHPGCPHCAAACALPQPVRVAGGRSLGLLSREQFEPDADEVETRPWIGERLRDRAGEIWLRLNWRPLLVATEFLDIAA